MNILIDEFPNAVTIAGHEVEIRPDFRTCLRIMLAYEDDELTSIEKQMILLGNLYPTPPDDVEEAIRQGMKFLDGGMDRGETSMASARIYSLHQDANLIFSAFRQIHGIDLETADLHWWKFIALFMDIVGSDKTTFGSLASLRNRVNTGRATEEEKESARAMGDFFALDQPDTRTPEEREMDDAFEAAVKGK